MTVGLAPTSAIELNNEIGIVMRNFADIRALVHQHTAWLAAETLTTPPYDLPPEDETLIKSAFNSLDADLQPIDMTFISRLIGLPTS